ncbi:MAG: hypothetical protein HY763_15775 [Planctomycetes bacterium]|nr:hypothetical protein [Planctomycetota bacterium]
MIWVLATRGATTKLRASPFTETAIEGVQGVVYRPGIEPVPQSGSDASAGARGTFARGLHRLSGLVFTYDGNAAETLLSIAAAVDLIIRYRAAGAARKRTILDVLFVGDSMVSFPGTNSGVSELVGVPFRAQIAEGQTLAQHVVDAVDP